MGDTRRVISPTTIDTLSNNIKQQLYGNTRWKLDYKSILKILNKIGNDPRAPNPNKIPYGMAVHSINNVSDILHDMGVGGSYGCRQAKQALTCGVIDLDDNHKVLNMKLLKAILPHKKDRCRKEWIDKCISYLDAYKKKESDTIFNKYQDLHRNS